MSDLVEFSAIYDKKPENILKYYEDNNIQVPDIPLFRKYLESAQTNKDEEYEINVMADISEKKPFYPTLKVDSEKIPKYVEPNLAKTANNNTIMKEISVKDITPDQKKYLLALANRESSFNPHVTNRFGYYGLYQFGDSALQDIGYNKKDLEVTENQHDAALKYAELNKKRLKPIIDKNVGKVINGIKITESGILAAAHLLGSGTVKDWFLGTKNTDLAKGGFKDANGTRLEEYLQLFE